MSKAPSRLDVDRGEERHDAPTRQRDGNVLEARDVVSLVVGQDGANFDLFTLVLEDLGESPIVGRAQLLAHIGRGQTEGARLRGSAGR